MSPFEVDIDGITEEHLNSLCQDQVEESLTLEFKRQLNLSEREEKAEAAKDVSAMANTAGGRILYGVAEKTLPNGSKVADSICPLTDAAIDSRLADVLYSSIHPRPRFRTRKVPVSSPGGFVLVVEVYPAYSGDLHMVTGFKEHRFYRRGEQQTVLMTEPEIREAYARIAASRQALEASIEKEISSELARVPATHESVLVVPWYGRRDLVNPRMFGPIFGHQLASAHLPIGEWRHAVQRVEVVTDGYRCANEDGWGYASVLRTGLVHLAREMPEGSHHSVSTRDVRTTLESLVAALVIARYVLQRAAYWGPVRVIHRFNIASPFRFVVSGENSIWCDLKTIPTGIAEHSVPEVSLQEHGTSISVVLRELLHQIFQTAGRAECPWFDASGKINEKMRDFLARDLFDQLAN